MAATYRCLGCLDHAVERSFDVSHLSRTCPTCGSFERLVHEAVVEQFRRFEDAPPEALDWGRLDRTEKLLVSERIARGDRTLEDFRVSETGDGAAGRDGGSAGTGGPDDPAADDDPDRQRRDRPGA